MKIRMFLASLLTTVLMLAFISPALAKEPVVVTEEHHEVWRHNCVSAGEKFKIEFEDYYTVETTTFYDSKDGGPDEPDRYTSHTNWRGTLTNLATGTVFRQKANYTESDKLPEKQLTFERGVFFHYSIPGHGVVAISAGKLTYNEDYTFIVFKGVDRPPYRDDDHLGFICDGVKGL